MKTKKIAPIFLAASLFFAPNAYAEAIDSDDSATPSENVIEEGPSENVDTLPPPSQELIEQNPWAESSTAPEGQTPSGQDEPEIWAIVDENGNTLNITVCDIDYCGSGWIPVAWDGFTPTEWARVVLQSKRNPETGDHSGGHWGKHNFSENSWYLSETNRDGSVTVYLIPVEYGSKRVCISNCPADAPEEQGEQETEILETQNEPNYTNEEVSERSTKVNVEKKNGSLVFFAKLPKPKNLVRGSVWVIAEKQNKKSIFVFPVAKRGLTKISIPEKYLGSKVRISYRFKGKKPVIKNTFLSNS
jgi:hypothetical protein